MSIKKYFILSGLLLTLLSVAATPCPQYSEDDNDNLNKTQEKENSDSIDNSKVAAAVLVGQTLLDNYETLSYISNPLLYLFGDINDENDKNSNLTQYEIQRGEALDDIVKRYGITEDELKRLNPDITIFYTGLTINVPILTTSTTPSTSDSADTSTTNTTSSNKKSYNYYASEIKSADYLLKRGDYKKAGKSYTEIIKRYSYLSKCGDAYYGRALASYNRSKWKAAIKDFEAAINDKELNSSSRDHCKELLAKARRHREEQLERRGEMWASIIQTGINTAANVVAIHEAEKQQRASTRNGSSSYNSPASNTSYSTSNYNGGNIAQQMSQPGYFNNAYQELLSTSITQVQQQEMSEYNQARQGALAMGKDLTLDEWRCQKGAAIMALKEQGIDIIAEQQELNRENNREWRESLAQESDERLQRIKDQYATKSGITTDSYSKSSSTSKSSGSSTSSYKGSSSSRNKDVSTPKNGTSYSQSGLFDNTNNNSHQQFKNGNKNVNFSDYTYKHRVTLYRQDGSNFRVAIQNAELYEKGANEYIKIGDTFFPAQSPQKVTKYRKRIVYGGVGLYYD